MIEAIGTAALGIVVLAAALGIVVLAVGLARAWSDGYDEGRETGKAEGATVVRLVPPQKGGAA